METNRLPQRNLPWQIAWSFATILLLQNVNAVADMTTGSTQNSNNYQTEVSLLHTRIDKTRLEQILVWDVRDANWRKPKDNEATPNSTDAPLLIVHLWADWCKPCREEFQVLKSLAPTIEARYRRRVRFIYVAMETGSANMERFLEANKDIMPSARFYLDAGEGGIASTLRSRLASGRLSLPTTLLLDSQRIVRQAIVGPINNRRAEFVDSINRLLPVATGLAP